MTNFLGPMRGSRGRSALRNLRTGALIATDLLPAFDSKSRRTGLLKHAGLEPGQAMIIAPTSAIHTFGMAFPIDVAFVRRDGRIVKIYSRMPAWRIAAAWGAYCVVEMAAGALASSEAQPGDPLVIEPFTDSRADI